MWQLRVPIHHRPYIILWRHILQFQFNFHAIYIQNNQRARETRTRTYANNLSVYERETMLLRMHLWIVRQKKISPIENDIFRYIRNIQTSNILGKLLSHFCVCFVSFDFFSPIVLSTQAIWLSGHTSSPEISFPFSFSFLHILFFRLSVCVPAWWPRLMMMMMIMGVVCIFQIVAGWLLLLMPKVQQQQ